MKKQNDIPVTQTVTNLDPKEPVVAYLQGLGFKFCKWPAMMHSCNEHYTVDRHVDTPQKKIGWK